MNSLTDLKTGNIRVVLNSCLGSGPFQLASVCTRQCKTNTSGLKYGVPNGLLDFIENQGLSLSSAQMKGRGGQNQIKDEIRLLQRTEQRG